jgi:hypothetical protein
MSAFFILRLPSGGSNYVCICSKYSINNLKRTLNNGMNFQRHSQKNESAVMPEGRDSDLICKMIKCVAREI